MTTAIKSPCVELHPGSGGMDVPIARLSVIALTILFLTSLPACAQARDYQVTGTVVEITDSGITIEKNGEKWEMARNATTKITGTPKPGEKITVRYFISADEIEVKDAKNKADKPAEKITEKKTVKSDKTSAKKQTSQEQTTHR